MPVGRDESRELLGAARQRVVRLIDELHRQAEALEQTPIRLDPAQLAEGRQKTAAALASAQRVLEQIERALSSSGAVEREQL